MFPPFPQWLLTQTRALKLVRASFNLAREFMNLAREFFSLIELIIGSSPRTFQTEFARFYQAFEQAAGLELADSA